MEEVTEIQTLDQVFLLLIYILGKGMHLTIRPSNSGWTFGQIGFFYLAIAIMNLNLLNTTFKRALCYILLSELCVNLYTLV